jgi:hypothetical protein
MTEASERVERFTNEIGDMKVRVGRSRMERWYATGGLVLMVAGVVLGVICYAASLNIASTPGSNVDMLQASSYETLALVGVGVSIIGGFVFLRYSLGRFLRMWLLRRSYEDQSATASESSSESGEPA